jgi:hypothetical protein
MVIAARHSVAEARRRENKGGEGLGVRGQAQHSKDVSVSCTIDDSRFSEADISAELLTVESDAIGDLIRESPCTIHI